MERPSVTVQFSPVLTEYGPFRLRTASLLRADGYLICEVRGYEITLPQPPQEDVWLTKVWRDDLPAVIAALRLWLEGHEHMLTEWQQSLASSLEQPDHRARLQAWIDENDARQGREAHAESPRHPRLSVDDFIAKTYEEETQRHQRVEEALSELESSYTTTT